MKKLFIYCFSLFVFSTFISFAENSFVELPTAKDGVRFIANTESGSVYIRNNGISLIAKKLVKENKHKNILSVSPNTYEIHRIDLDFVGSNKECLVTAPNLSTTNNFIFRNNKRLELSASKEVMIKNVYDGIDFKAYFNQAGEFQFDFIVNVGADPKQIKLQSKYQDNVKLNEDESLSLDFRFTSANLLKPYTYQTINSVRNEVVSNFNLNEDVITFNVGSYNKSKPLIIDPITRFMGSYYGGNRNDTGYDIDEDEQGNYYITGFTESMTDIAQAGYQMINGGLEDAYLAKFNANNQRLWGTYFGDYAFEVGYSLDVDIDGNIVLVGETSSDTNIATQNAHQRFYGGGSADGFIAKFTTTGQLMWATYYGGSDEDKLNDVVTDKFGNIYVVGFTMSDNNIAYNGYQLFRGGGYDAFVVKFNPLGVGQWATYYGGDYDDFGNGITLDKDGTIYFVGSTESMNNIAYKGNFSTLQGQKDAFVSCFESNGDIRWGTYYGGSNEDIGTTITAIDNYIYFAGNTKSDFNIAFNGFKNNKTGDWDGFVVKYDMIQQSFWGTYYGGTTNDFIYRITSKAPNIYIAGYTNSTMGVELLAWQHDFGGGTSDGFLAKYVDNGMMEWSTYYGGSGRDELRGVSNLNKLFVSGFTNSTNNIAQNGYDNSYSGDLDALFGEMSESELRLNLQDEEFCSKHQYTANIGFINLSFAPNNEFIVELSDEFGNFDNPTEIGRILSANPTDIELNFPEIFDYSKKYKLRMHSTSPEYKGIVSLDSITIYPTPPILSVMEPLCIGSVRGFSTNDVPNVSFDWVFQDGIVMTSSKLSRQVRWEKAGSYQVSLIANGPVCSDTNTIFVKINELPKAEYSGPTEVCGLSIVEYTIANKGVGVEYTWEINNGIVYKKLDNGNALVQWNNIDGDGEVLLIARDSITGCIAKNRLAVKINSKPRAIITGVDSTCRDCMETFTANDGWETEWLVINATIDNKSDEEISVKALPNADSLIIKLIKRNPVSDCADTNIKVVYLTDSPITNIAGVRSVCEYEQYKYTTSNNPNMLNSWTVVGGELVSANLNKAQIKWLAPGLGTLQLIQRSKDNKYIDTAKIQVVINPKPDTIIYNLPTEICQGETVTIQFQLKNQESLEATVNGRVYTNNEECIFTVTGQQVIHAKIGNEFGCFILKDIEILVKQAPPAPTISRSSNSLNSDHSGLHRWFLNGNIISGLDDSSINPMEDGTYSTQYFQDGCWSDTSEPFKYIKLGVEDNLLKVGISIYPNPADDNLIIKSDNLINKVELVDLLGKSVYVEKNIVNKELDISKLNAGIYFVKMWLNDKLLTKKIIIK